MRFRRLLVVPEKFDEAGEGRDRDDVQVGHDSLIVSPARTVSHAIFGGVRFAVEVFSIDAIRSFD
jgi:hypothetical protein